LDLRGEVVAGPQLDRVAEGADLVAPIGPSGGQPHLRAGRQLGGQLELDEAPGRVAGIAEAGPAGRRSVAGDEEDGGSRNAMRLGFAVLVADEQVESASLDAADDDSRRGRGARQERCFSPAAWRDAEACALFFAGRDLDGAGD